MIRSPNRYLLPAVMAGAALAGALTWSLVPGRIVGRSPDACLEAYREACRAGDAVKYRRCLGEPLLSQMRQAYPDDEALADALRRDSRGIKGWMELGAPNEYGDEAVANIEEVRESGQRRLRIFLEHSQKGWLIVRVDKGPEQNPDFRYGTRVGEEQGTP
jgi:hypothetical protein